MNIYSTRGIAQAVAQDITERALTARRTTAVNYFGDTGSPTTSATSHLAALRRS
jgi:hypothetical protein